MNDIHCTVIKTRFPAIYLQEKTQQQYIHSMIKFLWFNKQLLLLCLAGFSFCLVFLGQYIICHFLKKSSLRTSKRNFLIVLVMNCKKYILCTKNISGINCRINLKKIYSKDQQIYNLDVYE